MSGGTLADALATVAPPAALIPVGGGSITGMPGSPETTPTRLMPGAGDGTGVRSHMNDVPEPPKLTGKTFSSLEDLALAYPGLADPQSGWVIKVERISPKQRGGVMVGGDQGNFPRFHDGADLLTLDGFRTYFGGGKYHVTAYGPSEADPSILRRHHDIDLLVPEPMTQNAQNAPPGMHPFAQQAAVERAKQEGSLASAVVGPLLQSVLQKNDHPPAQNGDGVASIATAAMNQSATMAQNQAALAQQQLDAERARNERLEQRVADLAAKLGEQQHQSPADRMAEVMFNSRYSQQEAERMRQDYESRMQRQREDYESRIERMRADHATDVERTRIFQQQVSSAEVSRLTHEAQSLRSDIARERERADTVFTERLRMEQQRFEQQTQSLTAEHARAIDHLRADAKRNEDAIRRDAERDMKMLENSHKVALDALARELERARSDLAECKMNLKAAEERIQRELNEPFEVKMAKNMKFAELMGLTKSDGAPDAPGWQDRLVKLGETALKAAVPALAPMAAAAIQNRMGGGGGAAGGGGGMQPNPGQPPNHALPPGPPQQAPQRPRRGIQIPNVGEINERSDGIPIGDPVESGSLAQNIRPDPPPPAPPPPPANVSPPSPHPPATGGGAASLTMDQRARLQAVQASIKTNGPAPVEESSVNRLVVDLASACTQAYYRPAAEGGTVAPEEFAAGLKAMIVASNPELLPRVLAWVDADNAAKLIQLATAGASPPVDWSLDGPRQWLADVWVALA